MLSPENLIFDERKIQYCTKRIAYQILESNINTLSVVGFDGYMKDDIRQEEMIELISLYKKHKNAKEIHALTPTSYPIRKGSIYALPK